jgi:integrase
MENTKAGRKQKHHIDSKTRLPVVGLTRRPDGRWRIIGTHKTFREPDEQKAIKHFRELANPFAEAEKKFGRAFPLQGTPFEDLTRGFTVHNEDRFYAWIAAQIRTRPLFMAERTGIEQLGYLRDLKPPEPLPTFTEIEQAWEDHFKKSAEQKRRVLAAWRDFKRTTEARGISDITPKTAIAYRDSVQGRKLSPKMESNLFTRIRRLFTFARSREIAPDALAKVIDALKRLVPSDSPVSLDPQPIEPGAFHKLLGAADAEDSAMLLLMLNGGYYCAEVVRLKWDLIRDGCIVTHRAKHGRVVRACVLWRETLDALSRVKRAGEYIFNAYTGKRLGTKGAELRFRKLRKRAGVPESVTSSHLRDGAATAMAEAGVTDKHQAIVMGHRSGISDHYVKRNPKMVAPASAAIHRHYFASGAAKRRGGSRKAPATA